MEYITLLDGYALIYRSYFAFMRKPLINREGKNVSVVYGFFNTIFNYFKNYDSSHFAVVLDSKTPTFRHELFSDYKATREKTPPDLKSQIPYVEQILKELNIPILQQDGVEADDIIATIATKCSRAKQKCRIISGDKDLLQLVDNYVSVMKTKDGSYEELFFDDVVKSWGVKPHEILDYLSLLGDSADNVPGVSGIGEKGATKLISAFSNIENLYAAVESNAAEAEQISASIKSKLLADKSNAFLSKKLITLKTDLEFSPQNIKSWTLNREAANATFIKLGVPSLSTVKVADSSKSASDSAISIGALFDSAASNETEKKSTASSCELFENNQAQEEQKEIEKLDEKNCKLLTTLGDLEAELKKAASKKLVAFDTETTGTNDLEDKIVGFSFCYDGKKGFYFPIKSSSEDQINFDDEKNFSSLAEILNNFFASEELKIVGHNFKFDYKILKSNGFEPCLCYADTLIGAWLLESDLLNQSMDNLAFRYLNYQTIKFSDIVEKGKTFDTVELSKATLYASEDAIVTYRLWKNIEKKLKDEKLDRLFFEMEMKVSAILAMMEIEGIYLDQKALSDYGVVLEEKINSLENQICDLAGTKINLNSPKQLSDLLFITRKLPASKKTKTGYSTDIEVLESLVRVDPIIEPIIKFKSLKKLKSSYTDSLSSQVNPKTNRIHPHFLQAGTATGRLSCKDPNLQNIPIRDEEGRLIRSCFKATKGNLLLSADYGQIELAVLASLSKDKQLCSSFSNGEDIHKKTASLIFNCSVDEVTSAQRRIAKTINFGVMYGMSSFRLSKELSISVAEAKSFIDSYFNTYKDVANFIEKTTNEAKENGFITTQAGHKRTVFGINSTNKIEAQAASRIAINSPIQGTASDIMKRAMIAIDEKLKSSKLQAKMLLQIHDELLFEFPSCEEKELKELVESEMKKAAGLEIPVSVSIEVSKSWGDFH